MSLRVCCFLTAAILTACGCDRGPKLVPVNGKVTLDGKPLPFKGIYFHPDRSAGTEGNGAGGFTDPDGKYFLVANAGGSTRDKGGVQSGKYRVTVAEPTVPISAKDFAPQQQQQSESDAPAPAIGFASQPAKREIPAVYSSSELTPLSISVPENGGELNIELKSKP